MQLVAREEQWVMAEGRTGGWQKATTHQKGSGAKM